SEEFYSSEGLFSALTRPVVVTLQYSIRHKNNNFLLAYPCLGDKNALELGREILKGFFSVQESPGYNR
ncbi:MAG: hypothetical protein OEZ34_07180, partial [Spirochaetia bacterium]|nr:hypothetical protein [Spirochaetia bacterium]